MSLLSEQSVDSWDTRETGGPVRQLGRALADLATTTRIVAGSADLKYATLIAEFEDQHPDRFFQFGDRRAPTCWRRRRMNHPSG